MPIVVLRCKTSECNQILHNMGTTCSFLSSNQGINVAIETRFFG